MRKLFWGIPFAIVLLSHPVRSLISGKRAGAGRFSASPKAIAMRTAGHTRREESSCASS